MRGGEEMAVATSATGKKFFFSTVHACVPSVFEAAPRRQAETPGLLRGGTKQGKEES